MCPTILKGQGLANYYDEALRRYRQSGDIDVYVNNGREAAVNFAKSLGQDEIIWDYVHLQLNVWSDIDVELHYHVEVFLNLLKNKKLQKWFHDNEKLLYSQNGEIITPSVEMNAFYILLHIYRHFFSEGIGMKQLLDYYYVLKLNKGKIIVFPDGMNICELLKKFGIYRFSQGIMWIMQEVFALDKKYMYCEPLDSEGRFILDIVSKGGNFGYKNNKSIEGVGKLNVIINILRNNLYILRRHPMEAVLSPFWFVWHKIWKLTRNNP